VLLEQHLAGCESCKAELVRLESVFEALDEWPVMAEPADLTADVMSRVRAHPIQSPFRIGWSYPVAGLAGAVLVFTSLLTLLYLAPPYQAHLLRSHIMLRLEMLRLESLLIAQQLASFDPLAWGMISLSVAALVIGLIVVMWEAEAFRLWEPGL
jgi:hypothetical protein